MFPVAQLIQDLEFTQLPMLREMAILEKLATLSDRIDIILADEWPEEVFQLLSTIDPKVNLHQFQKPLSTLKGIIEEME